MVSKTCFKCKKTSYSSTREGKWICPYCGADLTHVKINENIISH